MKNSFNCNIYIVNHEIILYIYIIRLRAWKYLLPFSICSLLFISTSLVCMCVCLCVCFVHVLWCVCVCVCAYVGVSVLQVLRCEVSVMCFPESLSNLVIDRWLHTEPGSHPLARLSGHCIPRILWNQCTQQSGCTYNTTLRYF